MPLICQPPRICPRRSRLPFRAGAAKNPGVDPTPRVLTLADLAATERLAGLMAGGHHASAFLALTNFGTLGVLAGATAGAPVKPKVPDCLSNKRLLEEHEILEKARKSRAAVAGGRPA